MKYKDPTTGDFKDLKIRATDELPVGSEIDVDDNTTIPAGWEQTDDIIESGTGYTKYADGTMICYETVTTTSSLTAYYSTLTRTNDINVTFPETFTNIPNITMTPIDHQSIGCHLIESNRTSTGFACKLFKANGATDTVCMFDYIAIGRWK